ncbi:hypothetical protein [Xanthomonas albilineans]|uniref:hypothetical protein n=2 Tax=Xanthomonas albilineans TaxID=29447 RepID=UPI00345F1DE4
MRSRLTVAMLIAVSALAGCSTAPKGPPEPNMSRLVPVNKTLPSELSGQAPSSEGKNGGR